MTSVPSADQRPPLRLHDPASFSATNNPFGLSTTQGRSQPAGIFDVDDRATKRRKVDEPADAEGDPAQPLPSVPEPPKAPQPKYRTTQDLRLLSAVLTADGFPDNIKSDAKDLPLMPSHPWRDRPQKKSPEEPKPTHRSRPKRQVPCTPDTLVIPDSGPRLVNGNPAGYFPWGTRKHAEDNLSEINVKQGYYDRPPNPPEKELNTARVPLYNAFKHRGGVESLSTLFTIVLEAKAKHGVLTSASSFKPPPRVTLAEPRKKSWIADLADPNVPLRKLSRTIPQGIRGHSLLEQCLQNSVPLSRTIWFVKCVGANEIRTLKRKGTSQAAAVGGERNWLREWTLNVQQFLEAVLAQSGQPSWKPNLQYALRLTTRLYLENLVDRDHYLDWLVNTFAAVGNEKLPFWLMLSHVFKQDVAKFRKRGRRLAASLTKRYLLLKDSSNAMVQAVAQKLKDAIRGFVLHRPQLFLIPDIWPEVKSALETCLQKDSALETRLLQRLNFVNERCMGSNKQQYLARPVPRDDIIGILDATFAPFDVTTLSQQLLTVTSDQQLLILAAIEWATTKYRCGQARIYLVSRLLRKWQKMGINTDEAIIAFVAKCHGSPELFDSAALKHLAAELSRSRSFPSSKYMQWLSVRGLPWPNSVTTSETQSRTGAEEVLIRQVCSDETLLLAELLFSDVESHHLNLRNALLGRAGFDAELERKTTQFVQTRVRNLLGRVENDEHASVCSATDFEHLLSGWNWRVRSAVSHGLRGYVVAQVKRQATTRQGSTPLQKESGFTTPSFDFVRSCLEALGDDAVLADVVGLCSAVNDEQLQAALVDTVIRHAATFSAIGALEPLQTRFCQNYMSLRTVNPTMPLFATALLELCTTYPTKLGSIKLLQLDLIRGDRGRAIAACSPFSDGVAESLQHAEASFIDEFEAVLQSEPSMSEQAMAKMFALLVERMEKQAHGSDSEFLFTCCQLMARLRLCRRTQGDQLLKTWLVKLLSMNPTGFAQTLVSNLICVGAVSVDALVDAFAGHRMAPYILQHMFPTALPNRPYSVVTKWADFGHRKPSQLLNLTSQLPPAAAGGFDIQELCARIVVKSDVVLDQAANTRLKQTLDGFLGKGESGDASSSLEAMDSFSLPFVRLYFQLSATSTSQTDESGLAESIVSVAASGSIENIAKLLQSAGPELSGQVRRLLEDNIIEMLPSPSQGKLLDVSLDPERIERLQVAVDQAFLLCQPSSTSSSKNATQLIEKLQQFLKFLGPSGSSQNQAASPAASQKPAVTSPSTPSIAAMPSLSSHLVPSSPMDFSSRALPHTIIDYFRVLLNLLCLQRPAPPAASDAKAAPSKTNQEYVRVLSYLAFIATHPAFLLPSTTFPASPALQQRAREVVDFAYDVMATFVDDLSEESRILCSRILKDRLTEGATGPAYAAVKESQARLRWLFGSINAMGSDMPSAEEMGKGLLVKRSVPGGGADGKGAAETVKDWKPRIWEVLESQGRGDGEVSVGLGLFGARRP
ncbi:uncharacterized protein HMPREF1541_01102 [Cyphellophora europaea CBS 101466]|uniref:Mediator of RNA polymerase II transcription subunit 12 n=1 Tax=Cyphellophora europaea (strain CBS 101466) TaxID=1220924 RepID=W2SFZ3_CYPE1|nr:uncharacterized protein HMPREF1541_01102 [Cyphellophora europaea CBS 101466]ETN46913.1 hypothetical protein HMPREF1541_01102 [Cyphellophora europaea CBS 101466]